MATIFTFAGQKGGVGKSTLAIATAQEFYRRGFKTLLVDLDPQGTALTWSDVSSENERDTVPVIAMGENVHRKLPEIADAYDVVVVDCPGRDDSRQRKALAVSDFAVFPTSGDSTDVWALQASLDVVEQVRVFNDVISPLLVLNRMKISTEEYRITRKFLEQTGVPILETILGNRVDFGRFPTEGQGVVEFNGTSKAAKEIKCLVNEFEKKLPVQMQEVAHG